MTNKEAIEVLQRVKVYGADAENARQLAILALEAVDYLIEWLDRNLDRNNEGSATVNYVKHDEIQFCSKCKKNKKCTKQMEMLNKFTCEGYEECGQ